MKQRLIILSDLCGSEKSDWLIYYTHILNQKYDLVYYDSCQLGNVDTSSNDQQIIHQQFVEGGIRKAISQLIELEQNPIKILAFSIGGLIAWRYGLLTGNIKSLICISSTRLRKEVYKPKGEIELYFGEKDAYRPPMEWFINQNVKFEVIPNKHHEIYTEREFAEEFSLKLCNIQSH
ncbi:hypothetical protein KMW28_03605 [Flammeovirga yaeyamensis]|uniref:Alpha/beta hydrolase n=1 Tax=Flammeovirga yaeyamensis TaxID=367791 RepID=A0AAX1N5F1_9BACT|nr:alpha/beta hydrolase [Flammeovirga yaeyamensis]MBB3701267.1 hypothetical protein [Flammeovirga yaeyamensis]NMF38263.1 alpha/beta hydrolase [Flammeovirga yaeyamensis]QWG02674.1 hypothetical protein KMW28_03605 [Flammeovirga yaeyamensis]